MLDKKIPASAIIEFNDEPDLGKNFRINAKKHSACEALKSEFVYLVHDRFIPAVNFRKTVEAALTSRNVGFGAVDVLNQDGTLALGELRLQQHCVNSNFDDAIERKGRLIVVANDERASEKIAINGGQFFIRRSLMNYLLTPLRWGEMEDDVLSFDLRNEKGIWIEGAHMVTLAHRIPPVVHSNFRISLRYSLYSFGCAVCAFLLKPFMAARSITSVGTRTDKESLDAYIRTGLVLVDPLHKTFASDYLMSTIEKLSVRARVRSAGYAWHQIDRKWFGWELK
ncbi:hypothetical protein [Massilia sp. LXY-6]|uniref:hypothetical protein n=1 Tax=Massilia sp. LXY-6 TaxID=3379823 RepID=UPI003F4A346D